MLVNPHQVTRDFENALCEYTGARYAVAVNSCTMALLLAVAWNLRQWPGKVTYVDDILDPRPSIEIPKRTYVSVPMSIIHAGGKPVFRDDDWRGAYQLRPLPIWDSARWFTGDLYRHILFTGARRAFSENIGDQFVCVSFHASKTLGDTQGGAILHSNAVADTWLRRARFDGRTEGIAPKDDKFNQIGWHCYMSPDVATRLLWKLSVLPKHNEPLPNDDYPDLSQFEIFK